MKIRMQKREYNPNLEGFRKCYHCGRLYDETSDHTCYSINRIKDWKKPKAGKKDRKIHKPWQDAPGNDITTSDN